MDKLSSNVKTQSRRRFVKKAAVGASLVALPVRSVWANGITNSIVASGHGSDWANGGTLSLLTPDDWANHNVEGYLAAYLPKHSPVEGQSYEHWRAQRIKRVSHDADISLAINHLTTELLDNGEYKLLFIQRFSTKNYSDIVLKTLVFRQVGEHFYIANEQAHQSLTEETADYILWGIE